MTLQPQTGNQKIKIVNVQERTDFKTGHGAIEWSPKDQQIRRNLGSSSNRTEAMQLRPEDPGEGRSRPPPLPRPVAAAGSFASPGCKGCWDMSPCRAIWTRQTGPGDEQIGGGSSVSARHRGDDEDLKRENSRVTGDRGKGEKGT